MSQLNEIEKKILEAKKKIMELRFSKKLKTSAGPEIKKLKKEIASLFLKFKKK